MIYLIAALTFTAAALGTYVYSGRALEQRAVKASLLSIDDNVVTRVRDRDLLGPFGRRVAGPIVARLGALGRAVTPTGYVERTREKLTIGGHAKSADVDRFLAVRAATITAIPFVAFAELRILHFDRMFVLFIVGFSALLLILGPDAIVNRRVAARQLKIRRQLPDLLDLLTISVEAGLGFEQALDRTISGMQGELSDEFIRMLGEMRAGAGRADALRAVDTRTDVDEVRSFVMAILQADTFGVSISKVLRSQAKEMRIKRRQLAQELAQKAPIKMLVPMVFCIFPAMFVVVLGPAVINITQGLHKGP